ncbi:MAG: CvpA family protein [Candidatus Puniceispirillaceae bacterium]
MFDMALLGFFLTGAVLGYFRGAYASVILLLASYVPMFLFVYFYDFITGFVADIFANSGDGTTAALGGIGAFSGIIALVGFSGAVFFGTRLMLKIMKAEQLDLGDKIGGSVVGFIGQNIAATLAFFLIYTAIPAKTAQFVGDSVWVRVMRPIHLVSYPYYLSFLEARTQNLSISIAQNGVAETFIGGISFQSLNDELGFDTPSLSAASSALQELSRNINIDEITDLVETAKSQDITPEEIDRRIKAEQSSRLKEIQRQLQ